MLPCPLLHFGAAATGLEVGRDHTVTNHGRLAREVCRDALAQSGDAADALVPHHATLAH